MFQDTTEIVSARVLERRSETSKVIISHWQQRNLDTASNLIIERSMIADNYFEAAINVNFVDVSRWYESCKIYCFHIYSSIETNSFSIANCLLSHHLNH